MMAYSLWVMEYAAVPNYPHSGLIYGMHNQGARKLPYCYIVIKGQGQLAMVDVGYNHKAHGEVLANTYGVRGWRSPREVLAEIVADPKLMHLPIVVMTTSSAERDVQAAYQLRCNSYIVKPIDFKQFVTVIQSLGNYWFTVVVLPSPQSVLALPSPQL